MLRQGEKSTTLLLKNQLITGLKKMNISTGTHYRGIKLEGQELASFIAEHKEGNIVTYNEFVSAGTVRKGSYYEKTSKNIKIIMKSKTARDISELADGVLFRGRPPKEVVFLPDTKFKIDNIIQDGTNYYLKLIEL